MDAAINPEERQLRLPFDQYQRYRLVTDVLERLRGNISETLRLLDVGGAEGTILNFVDGDEVTILDQIAVEGVPGFVQGDATALPFKDESFDFVTSVDTYEHISPRARGAYLSELRRVSRKGVLLAAPFAGGGVEEAEEVADEFYRALYGHSHGWLEEHEEHGLPELDETRRFYGELGDSVTVIPNGYLPNWLAMICLIFHSMRLEGGLSRAAEKTNLFYNRFLYEYDNAEPCYRYLVAALKEPPPVELGDLASPPANLERAERATALLGSLATTLPLGSELRRLNASMVQRDNLLVQKEVQIQDLSRRLAAQVARTNAQKALQRENRKLRNQLETITNSRSWRAVSMLNRLRRLGR